MAMLIPFFFFCFVVSARTESALAGVEACGCGGAAGVGCWGAANAAARRMSAGSICLEWGNESQYAGRQPKFLHASCGMVHDWTRDEERTPTRNVEGSDCRTRDEEVALGSHRRGTREDCFYC
jgi:hypothetical protein